jgi:hypothetical protein
MPNGQDNNSPPIPQEWHDLWASIKRETKDPAEATHKLGQAIADKLDEAQAAIENSDGI